LTSNNGKEQGQAAAGDYGEARRMTHTAWHDAH